MARFFVYASIAVEAETEEEALQSVRDEMPFPDYTLDSVEIEEA